MAEFWRLVSGTKLGVFSGVPRLCPGPPILLPASSLAREPYHKHTQDPGKPSNDSHGYIIRCGTQNERTWAPKHVSAYM